MPTLDWTGFVARNVVIDDVSALGATARILIGQRRKKFYRNRHLGFAKGFFLAGKLYDGKKLSAEVVV